MVKRSNLEAHLGSAKLGFCWLMALGSVFAQADSYKIKNGDTISGIAHKFHVRTSALLEANDLTAHSYLRIGRKLHIPSGGHSEETSSRPHKHKASAGGYTVRNGDNDWAIAHRLHLSLRELHAQNPSVDFSALQVGTHLSIPSSTSSGSSSSGSGSSGESETASTHLASRTEEDSPARGSYRVSSGENDWTIAAKLGITLKSLHRNNPGVDWDALRVGTKLHVPTGVAAHASTSRRIRTRLATTIADGVVLRRGPSTDSDKVTTVDAGTIGRVLDHEGKWYKLRFPKGTEAWVRGDLLNPVKHHHEAVYASSGRSRHSRRRRHGHSYEPMVAMNEIKSSKLLSTAWQYRNTPYRTGGTSRSSGFDCSGFTSTVYRKNGIPIPRTAAEQSGVGSRVSMGGLKKGDLVFFRTNRGVRINHVGMYIGDGKFIHASSGGGRVQVSSLSEGYYRRRFAGGRRIVKASHKKHSA